MDGYSYLELASSCNNTLPNRYTTTVYNLCDGKQCYSSYWHCASDCCGSSGYCQAKCINKHAAKIGSLFALGVLLIIGIVLFCRMKIRKHQRAKEELVWDQERVNL